MYSLPAFSFYSTSAARSAKRRQQNPRRKLLIAEQLEARQLLAIVTANFSDLSLAPESHVEGPAPNGVVGPHHNSDPLNPTMINVGSFRSRGIELSNRYNVTYDYGYHFGYSNETDTTTGFPNEYSAFTGGGAGDANFGVAYMDQFGLNPFNPANAIHLARVPTITIPTGTSIDSVLLTNTTYAALSMRDGDTFAKKFGGDSGNDPDWFKVTAYATDINGAILPNAPEFYLADFRNADNTQDFILDTWSEFDLSALAGAKKIYFYVSSSDPNPDPSFGFNTPTYFAIDDIAINNTSPVLRIISPGLTSIDEDSPNAPGILVSDLLASAVTDPDAGALQGMAIVDTSSGGGDWQYSLNGSTWLNLGSPSETFARLLPANNNARVRFVPDSNFSGELTIRYRAWDQTEGIAGGVLNTAGRTGNGGTFSVDIETAKQSVSSVNDAPILDSSPTPVFPTIAEDVTKPAGMFVADLVTGAITDIDPGAQDGIGIISAPSQNGVWQFTLDGTVFNPIWQPVGPLLSPEGDGLARLLLADAKTKVRFVPTKDFNGEVTLRFQAWDNSDGVPGGTLPTATRIGGDKCFSMEYDDASIIVTPENDAPVLDTVPVPSLGSIREDLENPSGTLVKWLANPAITDVDEGAVKGLAIVGAFGANGDWQFSLDGDSWQSMTGAGEAQARLLPADDTTRVRFVPKLNYNGQVWLTYRAWDQTEGTAGGTLATAGRIGHPQGPQGPQNPGGCFSVLTEAAKITVTAVNDAPVVALSGTIGYVRNQPAKALAPFARVTDVDSPNFDGGRLKVRIDSGKSNFNLLAIGAGFTIDETFKVHQGTTHIGTLNPGGGDGTTDLVVTFNASATKAIVQELVRSITFRTLGGAAGTRVVKFSVSDGDGGLSAEATKTVNVT